MCMKVPEGINRSVINEEMSESPGASKSERKSESPKRDRASQRERKSRRIAKA